MKVYTLGMGKAEYIDPIGNLKEAVSKGHVSDIWCDDVFKNGIQKNRRKNEAKFPSEAKVYF